MKRGASVILLCVMFGYLCPAQTKTAAAVSICRARQIELFNEGGEGATGHGLAVVGLRNISAQPCTLSGSPLLEFFDTNGQPLQIPYGKNETDYMFPKQPEQPVHLAPGNFAYFMIGTTVGDRHLHFDAMRVVLPGDNTPLVAGGAGYHDLYSINVSAIVPGIYTELLNWAAPTERIPAPSGALHGLSLTLSVPPQAPQNFDAHFLLRNSGAKALNVKWNHCTLHEKLTDEAGAQLTASQSCGPWNGEISVPGLLQTGARATTDFMIAGDDVAGKLCRIGLWRAELSLETPVGTVHYPAVPFHVTSICNACCGR